MAQAGPPAKGYPGRMRRPSRLLGLLLLAATASAQNMRATIPQSRSVPVTVLPYAGHAAAIGTALASPALTPALTPLLPAPVLPALPAGTQALPAPVLAAAPDARDLHAAAGAAVAAALPQLPAAAKNGRYDLPPGAELFDGGARFKTETGAVFAPVHAGRGAFEYRLVRPAPSAPTFRVPGTEGLAGAALLDQVGQTAARGQRQNDYESTSDAMFSRIDSVVVNGVRGVVDSYSGVFVPGTSKEGEDYPEPGDRNGDGHRDSKGMNVEHLWPQSLFEKALPMRSDVHHLMTTFMHPNSVRAALPFGVVRGRPEYQNDAGAKMGGGVFEPPDAVKGVVARRMLYFYARYKDSRFMGRKSAQFWNRQIDVLLDWNRRFPPNADEMQRNDRAQEWQGNRNPFVDDHALADRIGAEALRAGTTPRGLRGQGRKQAFHRPSRGRR